MLKKLSGKIFFSEQNVAAEWTTKSDPEDGREGVDAHPGAPCDTPMANANAVSEFASHERRLDIAGIEHSTFAEPKTLGTGVDSLDEALEGGLRSGMLSEIACPAPSSGAQSLMLHLMAAMRAERKIAALVDGANSFDPQSAPPALLEYLLLARCSDPHQAMTAASILLHDENVGMALVDLRWNDPRQLQRIKSAEWYRLQRLAEQSGSYVCIFTPQAMIPSAQMRLALHTPLSLELADASLTEIGSRLSFEVLRFRKREAHGFPNLIKRKIAQG